MLLLFAFINFSSLDAQVKKITVKGFVKDETGLTLPGVGVSVKGTSFGTTTTSDGAYTIQAEPNQTLVFSFIGYQTKEVTVNARTEINIVLQSDVHSLDQVVVIGYGTVKKSDLTGSVGTIKADEIKQTPTIRLDDAMRGKVAGLQITPTSSAPGAASTIRIRGSNSLQGNNEPLYVIDGFVGAGNLNDINTADIESVEILKDASATAIYGSRGSNGVIIITTKKGKAGVTKISYDTYANFASPTRFLNVMNAAQFASWQNEVKGFLAYPNPESLGAGTNYQKEIYKNNALMMNHNLSVSGGNDKSIFYVSGNYLDQDGIHIESNFKRYQFRVNTENKIGEKFKFGTNLSLSRTINKDKNTSAEDLIGWFPTIPVKDANGNFTYQTQTTELASDNPVSVSVQSLNTTYAFRTIGNAYGELEILKGLKYKLNFGLNYNTGRTDQYLPTTLFSQTANQGTATINNTEYTNLLIENTLNYNKTIGDHSFSGLFGYTRQTIKNFNNSVQTTGFVTDAYAYNNLAAGVVRSDATSNNTLEGLESYLFRANYSYKSKYLITTSARLDGSSVFAKNNKWGTFPSVALAWNIGNENFIRDLGTFDNLKLRASYGELGNPGVDPGASLTKLAQNGNNYILGASQSLVAGIAANTLGNDNLKWETTKQYNYGIDVGFFKNRLSASLDYYTKKTTNLLVNVPVLWLTGFQTSLSNFGSVSNKGFEVTINSVNLDKGNFKWTTNFNIATNKNKILDLSDPTGKVLINNIGRGSTSISGILQEGQPLGSFYGLVANGIWHSQAEIDASGLSGFSVFPGGRRYVDIDGDKVINQTLDRQIIGNANPKIFGGIGNTLSYKRLELNFYFSFVQGNQIFNETGSRIGVAFDNNTFAEFVNRWTPTNTNTNVPSVQAVQRSLTVSNSSYVEDGSFLRLRNVSLSYDLPVKNIKWLNGAQVYVSGTNVLLFDNYSGYDPEVNRGFNNTRRGYDLAQDPSTKSFTLGARFNF
ncbi:SusC/RagA family TonB-linked outer membrane protein [Pedobacter segetis]|nr:TonB-dependent receptor [Pedobacter segetis]